MELPKDFDPIMGDPPREVPLGNAPLLRAIAQVRFPPITGIQNPDFIASFQEAIRPDYPVLRGEQVHRIIFAAGSQAQAAPSTIWRFHDISQGWRVSLGSDFLALETTKYVSRIDFLERFGLLIRSLEDRFHPAMVDRLGIRYIDRVSGNHVGDLELFLRKEICGVLATPLKSQTNQMLTEALLNTREGASLRARWGFLPPNATIDAAAIDPIPEPSWILDLDMFSTSAVLFDADQLSQDAAAYAERIYSFFRWAVTKEFLAAFGGGA